MIDDDHQFKLTTRSVNQLSKSLIITKTSCTTTLFSRLLCRHSGSRSTNRNILHKSRLCFHKTFFVVVGPIVEVTEVYARPKSTPTKPRENLFFVFTIIIFFIIRPLNGSLLYESLLCNFRFSSVFIHRIHKNGFFLFHRIAMNDDGSTVASHRTKHFRHRTESKAEQMRML